MRLADIDKFIKDFPIRLNHYDKENGSENFVLGIEAVLDSLDNAPTVKAIPIEWLKLKIDTVLNIYPNGNDETEVLCKLLYDWEKENEINRCRQNETRG